MDGRDVMPLSGGSSYYMQHRRLAETGTGSQLGLTASPRVQAFSNTSTSLPVPSTTLGGGSVGIPSTTLGGGSVGIPFHIEPLSDVSQQGLNVGSQGSGASQSVPVKRKRGRPRKYGPDGAVSLALSSVSTSIPVASSRVGDPFKGLVSGSVSAVATQKRGRGRPPGTGKKQQLASCGEWISSSAGTGFTPHIITISAGEDITSKIMSFSQQGSRAVCVLSANGAVSAVTLRQPATSSGTVTYEGRFEILGLFGSYILTDDGETRSRSGDLSISLSGPDGRIIGGGVGGMLIAASPVQVIVGSFIYGGRKAKKKPKAGPGFTSEADVPAGDEQATSPTPSTPLDQSFNAVLSGWSGLRQADTLNTHTDIDLTRG